MRINQYIPVVLLFVSLFILLAYRKEIATLRYLPGKSIITGDKEEVLNYVRCQTLKTGMTEADILRVMGKPADVYYSDIGPQKNKKVLVYKNPSTMDDDNRIYIDTSTALSSLIYCCNIEIKYK